LSYQQNPYILRLPNSQRLLPSFSQTQQFLLHLPGDERSKGPQQELCTRSVIGLLGQAFTVDWHDVNWFGAGGKAEYDSLSSCTGTDPNNS